MEMKQPAQPAGSMGADYAKGLPFVADDGSLTFHGITLYGAIDIGVAYQTHGTPLSNSAGSGLEYLISKNSNHSQFSVAPNAMTTSNIGLKGTVEMIPGVSAIFNLQTAFLPTSGRLADGLGSIVQNNGVPLGSQTSNADSSRNGQAFNSVAWAGLSSPTYGALTFGRQNALTLDGVLAYDPMGGSSAFSVIGFQGTTAGARRHRGRPLRQFGQISRELWPVPRLRALQVRRFRKQCLPGGCRRGLSWRIV